jgi:hypothetical protein
LYFFWNRLIILWKKNMEIGNYWNDSRNGFFLLKILFRLCRWNLIHVGMHDVFLVWFLVPLFSLVHFFIYQRLHQIIVNVFILKFFGQSEKRYWNRISQLRFHNWIQPIRKSYSFSDWLKFSRHKH